MYKSGEWFDTGAPETGYTYLNPKNYRMDETSQNYVIRPFGKNEICLHIDDGCMGGGNSIGHPNNGRIDWVDPGDDSKPGDNNDFLDIKWGNNWDTNNDNKVNIGSDNLNGNFDPDRWKVFHYCLFVDVAWHDKSVGGTGERKGDDLFLGVTKLKSWSSEDNGQIAKTFIHELGHNFDLDDNTGKSMDQGASTVVDYTSTHWANIKLDEVATTPD
jgi:hypothetical protein